MSTSAPADAKRVYASGMTTTTIPEPGSTVQIMRNGRRITVTVIEVHPQFGDMVNVARPSKKWADTFIGHPFTIFATDVIA